MSVNKKKSPLIPVINSSDGKEYFVHPIDAIEIVRLGQGKYKDISDAPRKIQRELDLIDDRIAQATKSNSEVPTPKKSVRSQRPAVPEDVAEESLEDLGEDEDSLVDTIGESTEAPTRRGRRRATAL